MEIMVLQFQLLDITVLWYLRRVVLVWTKNSPVYPLPDTLDVAESMKK